MDFIFEMQKKGTPLSASSADKLIKEAAIKAVAYAYKCYDEQTDQTDQTEQTEQRKSPDLSSTHGSPVVMKKVKVKLKVRKRLNPHQTLPSVLWSRIGLGQINMVTKSQTAGIMVHN